MGRWSMDLIKSLLNYCKIYEKNLYTSEDVSIIQLLWWKHFWKIPIWFSQWFQHRACLYDSKNNKEFGMFYKADPDLAWIFRKSGTCTKIHCVSQKLIFDNINRADFKYDNSFLKPYPENTEIMYFSSQI